MWCLRAELVSLLHGGFVVALQSWCAVLLIAEYLMRCALLIDPTSASPLMFFRLMIQGRVAQFHFFVVFDQYVEI